MEIIRFNRRILIISLTIIITVIGILTFSGQVFATSSQETAESWLLKNNKGMKLSEDKKNFIVDYKGKQVSLPRADLDRVVAYGLSQRKIAKVSAKATDPNKQGWEQPVEFGVPTGGDILIDQNNKYLTAVQKAVFGPEKSEGGIIGIGAKTNAYDNMTHMVLKLNSGILKGGHFDMGYQPKDAATPWIDGKFTGSGKFPFSAALENAVLGMGTVNKNLNSGSYGVHLRMTFDNATDATAMAKSVDFSTMGASSNMDLRAFGLVDLPLTNMHYPITVFPNYTKVNEPEDPGSMYFDMRGVNIRNHPDYLYETPPLVITSVQTTIGALGDINGWGAAHWNWDMSRYTGNHTTQEMKDLGFDPAVNPEMFEGVDDSPQKILTRRTLPPDKTHKYSMTYHVYTSNSLLAPSLGSGDGKLDNIDSVIINPKKMDLAGVESDKVDTWSAYLSPIDSLGTFNTKDISTDLNNEFKETANQTTVLPGTNFQSRKIKMTVKKDGRFGAAENLHRFDRAIDFFTKEDVTNKVKTGETRKSNITNVDVTPGGDIDKYNQWVTVEYTGKAHYKDGSNANTQSNTMQLYQTVELPTLKLDGKLKQRYLSTQDITFSGKMRSTEQYDKGINNSDIYYSIDNGEWLKGTTSQINAYQQADFSVSAKNTLAVGQHEIRIKGTDRFHLDTNIEKYQFEVYKANFTDVSQKAQVYQQAVTNNDPDKTLHWSALKSLADLPMIGQPIRYQFQAKVDAPYNETIGNLGLNTMENENGKPTVHPNVTGTLANSGEYIKGGYYEYQITDDPTLSDTGWKKVPTTSSNANANKGNVGVTLKLDGITVHGGQYVAYRYVENGTGTWTYNAETAPDKGNYFWNDGILTADGLETAETIKTSETARVRYAGNKGFKKLTQTVEDLTKNTTPGDSAEVEVGDSVRYVFKTEVTGTETNVSLNNLHLTTTENDSQHTDTSGALDADDVSDASYSLDQGKNWKKVGGLFGDGSSLTKNANGVVITLPDKKVYPGTSVWMRYTKKVKTEVAAKQFLYNDAVMTADNTVDEGTDQFRSAVANVTKLTSLHAGNITVRYVDRQTGALIQAATTDNTGQEVSTGDVGETKAVQPKDLGKLGYTIVDSSDTDQDVANIKDWTEPAVDYQLIFASDPQTITYRYEKSRIGIRVPDEWLFGKYAMDNSDKTYYLKSQKQTSTGKTAPESIDVVDYYTTKKWSLSVKQENQFTGQYTDDKGNVKTYRLDNAELRFTDGNVALTDNDDTAKGGNPVVKSDFTLTPGATDATEIMSLAASSTGNGKYASHGFGTWQYRFGDNDSANRSVGLYVPGATLKYSTTYTTDLTWTVQIGE